LRPERATVDHQSRIGSRSCGAGPGGLVGATMARERPHGALVPRGGEASRQTRRCGGAGAQAGRHLVCAVARRRRLQSTARCEGALVVGANKISEQQRRFTSDGCPETVTAARDLGSFDPVAHDCGPSTANNLCAIEREYSYETTRHRWPRLRSQSRASRLRRSLTRPLTTCSPLRSSKGCDADASPMRIGEWSEGRDLRLTQGPLHTGHVNGKAVGQRWPRQMGHAFLARAVLARPASTRTTATPGLHLGDLEAELLSPGLRHLDWLSLT